MTWTWERTLEEKTREGGIDVVEEDAERRQARVPGRYSTGIRV